MRFWFVHSGEVPLHDQIVTQVSLGILSGELAPAERLPSIRELARRFKLHPNTISAGYRALEHLGWVEFRHGSGVYVRATRPHNTPTPQETLDSLIQNLLRTTRALGLPTSTLPERLHHWLNLQPPTHFLLIEPDDELREIVTLELQQALQQALQQTLQQTLPQTLAPQQTPKRTLALPVLSCNFESFATHLAGAITIVLPSKLETARTLLPTGTEIIPLRVRSIPTSMAEWLPAPTDALVGIASRWPEFLRFARTMLVAAGFSPDSLVLRDPRQPGWSSGLGHTTGIVCDVLTAQSLAQHPLPGKARIIPFRLLAEDCAEVCIHEQLRQLPPDPPTAAAPASVEPPHAPRSAARRRPPPPRQA